MAKIFTLQTSDREPKPRSKRLRELGVGASGSTGSTIVTVASGGTAADASSHTHANKADLDKLSTDTDGYVYITQQQEVEETGDDGATSTTWTEVTDKVKSGYADNAAMAYDLTPDSPVRDQFLSKVEDDVATGLITFAQGLISDALQSSQFVDGFGGAGYSVSVIDGQSYLVIDNAYIRNKATFEELDIRKITHSGGVIMATPANADVVSVGEYYAPIRFITSAGKIFKAADGDFYVTEADASAYKCYFKATDGEKTIDNDWRAGDLALCHEYNTTGAHYLWRKVVAVSAVPEDGYHWVALSKTDGEGDAPMSGDTLVCFGSANTDRQAAIVMSANGNSAPSFTQLSGISGYHVDESNIVTLLSPTRNIITGDSIYLRTNGVKVLLSDRLESIVTKINNLATTYNEEDFDSANVVMYGAVEHALAEAVGVSKVAVYKDKKWMCLYNVKQGDCIHSTKGATYIACDGDKEKATSAMSPTAIAGEYNWQGLQIDSATGTDYSATQDIAQLYIVCTDVKTIEVTHVSAGVSAQSRIQQSADSVVAKVGDCGIDIDSKTITLDSERTIVKGDLDVRKVTCYYDNGNPKSSYNGSNNGTLVYYYPNGNKMREDVFLYDDEGGVTGMMTIYYKADGTMAWQLTQDGMQTTLSDYWSDLGKLHYYSGTLAELKAKMRDIAMAGDNIIEQFSQSYFSQFACAPTSQYADYSGKITAAKVSSAKPTDVTLFDGIVIYSVDVVSQSKGVITYRCVYSDVTSALGDISSIDNFEFNNI